MNHHGFRLVAIWVLITVQVVTICACSVTKSVTLPGNEIPVGLDYRIVTVKLTDGKIIEFDGIGGTYVEKTKDGKAGRVIVGTSDGSKIEIESEKVTEVTFEHTRSSGTGSFFAGFGLGLPVGAALFYLIIVTLYAGH